MTENEAIKAIEHDLEWHSKELQPKYKEVLRYAIQALSEIQQYRAIGTIDEFKAIKQWKSDVMEGFCKYDASSFEEIVVNARAKAIDEFTEALIQRLQDCIEVLRLFEGEDIFEIAEQMKAGGKCQK